MGDRNFMKIFLNTGTQLIKKSEKQVKKAEANITAEIYRLLKNEGQKDILNCFEWVKNYISSLIDSNLNI